MKIDSNWVQSFITNHLEPATRNGGISTEALLARAGLAPEYGGALKMAINEGQIPGYAVARGKNGGIVREEIAANRTVKANLSVAEKIAKAEANARHEAARAEALRNGQKPPVRARKPKATVSDVAVAEAQSETEVETTPTDA